MSGIESRFGKTIIAMAGLPGSGKSTLARALAQVLRAVVLDKDTLRAALFATDEIEYSRRQDDFVFSRMLQNAEEAFRKDPSRIVILDGRTFSKRDQMDVLVATCQRQEWDLRVLYCICSDETARLRIENDIASHGHPAADRDFTLYQRVKAAWEPLLVPHLTVNTEQPLETCVLACVAYLDDLRE